MYVCTFVYDIKYSLFFLSCLDFISFCSNNNYFETLVKLDEWSNKTSSNEHIIQYLQSATQRSEDQIQYWKNQVEKCEKELSRAEGKVEIIDLADTSSSGSGGGGGNGSGRNVLSNYSTKKRKSTTPGSGGMNRRKLPTSNTTTTKQVRGQKNNDGDEEDHIGTDGAAEAVIECTVEGRDYLSLVEGTALEGRGTDELERVGL